MRNRGRRGLAMNTGSRFMEKEPTGIKKRMMAGNGSGRLRGSRMQQQPRSLLNKLDYQGGMKEQRNRGEELLERPAVRDRSPYGHGGGMKQSSELGYYDERGDSNRYMEEQAVYQQESNNQDAGKYEQQKEYGQEHYENAEMHFDYNHGIKSSQEVDPYREYDYNQLSVKQRPDMYKDQSSNQRGVLGKPPARGGKVEMPRRLFDEPFRPGLAGQRGNQEQPREPRSLLQMPHEERDMISQSIEHHDYIQQEHQRGVVDLPREQQGHVNSSREQRSHMDSLREQHGLMELPREQHGHMDSLSEQRGPMELPMEQHGHMDSRRDQHGLMELPREQHGHMDSLRDQGGLMELPMEQHGHMDSRSDQHGLMELPREQHGHMDSLRDQGGLMELPREQHGHMDSLSEQRGLMEWPREQHGHMDSRRDQRGLMELPREQHGHMDSLSEQRVLMKPQREQRGHIDPPRDQRSLMETTPGEQHGFIAMQREHHGLMEPPREHHGLMELPEPPRPPMDLMDSSREPRSLMDTPMNQRGLMDPSWDARDQRDIRDAPRDQIGLFDVPRDQKSLQNYPSQQKVMNKNQRNRQNKELKMKADMQRKLLLEQEKLKENEQMEQVKLLEKQQQVLLMQQQQHQIQQQRHVEMEQQEIRQQMQQAGLIIAGNQGSRGGGGSIPSIFDLPSRGKRPAPPSRMSDHKRSRTMSEDRRDRRPTSVPERRRSPINRSIERRDQKRPPQFSSPAKKQYRKDSGLTRNATSKPASTIKKRGMNGRARVDKEKGKDEKGKSRDESNKYKDEKKKSKDEKGKDKVQSKTEVILIVDGELAEPTKVDVVMSADKRDRRPPSVPEQKRSPRKRSIERQRNQKRHTRCSSPAKKENRHGSGSTTNSTSKPASTSKDISLKGRAREDKGKGKDEKGKSRDESNKHKDEKGKSRDESNKHKDEKGKSRDESNKHKDKKEKSKYEKEEDKKQLKTEVTVIVDEQFDAAESTEDVVSKIKSKSSHDDADDELGDLISLDTIGFEDHDNVDKTVKDTEKEKFTAPAPVGTRGAATSTPKTDSKPMNVKCITPVKLEEESVVPEIYDSSVAVGQRYIVSGFFCKLCQKFYNNEIATKISHCQSQTHYENLKNTLATKHARGVAASIKSEIGHPLLRTGEKSEENKDNLVESGNQSMNKSSGDTLVINMNIK